MSHRTLRAVVRRFVALFSLLGAPLVADVESELRSALVGRFALTRGALLSECTDHFTDHKVTAGRVSGGTGTRFEAGELVRIDNVKIGALSGLDVNLTIVEPFLLSFVDGPFTVHEERRCRAQLNFEVPREVRKDRAQSLAAIAAVLERFDDDDAARRGAWNRRARAPFPKDWEKTRVAYGKWKVEHRNELVRAKTEEVLRFAEQALTYMSGDEDYLASFAAGARYRSDSWSSCEAMLTATFSISGSGKNRNGWADGQKVAWATHLARSLQDCLLEVD